VEHAFKSARRAINLGYDEIEHMKKDPDLKNLRKDPRFAELLYLIRARQVEPQSN